MNKKSNGSIEISGIRFRQYRAHKHFKTWAERAERYATNYAQRLATKYSTDFLAILKNESGLASWTVRESTFCCGVMASVVGSFVADNWSDAKCLLHASGLRQCDIDSNGTLLHWALIGIVYIAQEKAHEYAQNIARAYHVQMIESSAVVSMGKEMPYAVCREPNRAKNKSQISQTLSLPF